MSTEVQKLKDNVAALTTVTGSAVALIQGLADQIKALKEDPAALNALADEIASDAQALADAVAANTPAP